MADHTDTPPPVVESWDTYWRGVEGGSAAYSSSGTSHPLVSAFWDEVFAEVKRRYPAPRIIDIASGTGAVVERVYHAYGSDVPPLTCLDVSAGAVRGLTKRWPAVHGIVADARSVPLPADSVDVATSQFGVEYAGLAAVREMARLVARGGRLVLVMHHRWGRIYKECAASLDAVRRMQQAGFIGHSMRMFEAAFAACRGADRGPYEAAAGQLVPAIRALEAIMRQYGPHVANDTVARLYRDVDVIHRRLQHYEPAEVLSWLSGMEGELEAYAGRMASMCDSALDNDAFQRLCDGLVGQGFAVERADALMMPGPGLPLAWALIAVRT